MYISEHFLTLILPDVCQLNQVPTLYTNNIHCFLAHILKLLQVMGEKRNEIPLLSCYPATAAKICSPPGGVDKLFSCCSCAEIGMAPATLLIALSTVSIE